MFFEYLMEDDEDPLVEYFDLAFRAKLRRINLARNLKVILDTTHMKPVFEDDVVAGYDLETADFHVVTMPTGGHGGGKSPERSTTVMLANPRVRFLTLPGNKLAAYTDERWVDLLSPYVQVRQLCTPLVDPKGRIFAPVSGDIALTRLNTKSYVYGGEYEVYCERKKQKILRNSLIVQLPKSTKAEEGIFIGNWDLTIKNENSSWKKAHSDGEEIGYAENAENLVVAKIGNNGPLAALTGEYGIEMNDAYISFIKSIESVLPADSAAKVGGCIGCMISDVSAQLDEFEYERVKVKDRTVLMTGLEKANYAYPVDQIFAGNDLDISLIGEGKPFVLVNKRSHLPGETTKFLMLDIVVQNDKSPSKYAWQETGVDGLPHPPNANAYVDSITEFRKKVDANEYHPSYPDAMRVAPTVEVALQRIDDRKNAGQKAKRDGLAIFSSMTARHSE